MIERMIGVTEFSTAMLVTAAKHIPADKLGVSPGGKAKSPLEIMTHCANFPRWIIATIKEGQMASFAESEQFASMDAAIAGLKNNQADFYNFARTLSDDDLAKPIQFPWASSTVGQTLMYQEWNNTYHFGQLSMIQMLLGDEEMYLPGQ